MSTIDVIRSGVELHIHGRTAEVASREVEFGRSRDGAGVTREREALVVVQVDVTTVCLEHADSKGQLPCVWDWSLRFSRLCQTGHTQIGSESANVPDRAFLSRMSILRFVSRPSSGEIAPGRQGNVRGKFRDWHLFCVELNIHRFGSESSNAPVRAFFARLSDLRLVSCPSSDGTVPVRQGNV